ncbi:MAG: aldolase/citrate lyase family protein [Pseudomonadota bacterium]
MSFRERLSSGDLIWGPFFTNPALAPLEATARIDCDCVCLDGEHGIFDRSGLNRALLALRSVGTPSIVRVSENTAAQIGSALDSGADAILCPHIRTADAAKALADHGRYATGRGFSGSVRSAGYGAQSLTEQIDRADRHVAIIAQIEDADALEHAEPICATPGLDAIFIGRSDLTVSMGQTDRNAPAVTDAVIRVASLAQAQGKAVGTFVATPAEIPFWRDQGIHFFLMGSDIGLLVAGANGLAKEIRKQA